MHRDYFDLSEDLVVEVYRKKLIVRNPGRLLGLTVEDLGKKSRIRNTIIADLLLRTLYVEKLGTGFIRMNTAMQKLGLKPVAVCVDDFSFSIEWSAERNTVADKLTETQKGILVAIRDDPQITIARIAEICGISTHAIQKNIELLKNKKLLLRIGADRSGHWEVVLHAISSSIIDGKAGGS
jgi:ATP-dependent DNA helicase RecG